MPDAPNASNTPNAPTTPDTGAQFNLNDAPPSQSASDAISQLGRGNSERGLLASNTGGIADPGMIGDFFGATSSAPSIIAQDFLVPAYGLANGSIYDFETSVPIGFGPPQVFNDISSTSGLDANGRAPLGLPAPATDLPGPMEPGYTWGGGTAQFVAPGSSPGYGDEFLLNYGYSKTLLVPSSFSQQRIKLAENASPIPQNRIFMNYSMFGNVPLTQNGITVNRFSPGFETLLFSPNASFELRAPFATTLNSDIALDGGTNTDQVEFGNLFFSLKRIVFRRNQFMVSTGMSMTAPTADNIRILNNRGTEVVRINNESVHLMPFVGFFHKPSQRSFVQGFMQVDVDVNGNPVFLNPNVNQNNLNQIGRLQDLTLLYLDLNFGYWIYRSNGSGLTGIAPLIEGHMNRSLSKADCVIDPTGRTRIQLPIQEFDNFNAVGGLVFEFNRRSRLALGYGVPIGNGADRAFDSELRVTFNRYY